MANNKWIPIKKDPYSELPKEDLWVTRCKKR